MNDVFCSKQSNNANLKSKFWEKTGNGIHSVWANIQSG